jgi:hypothetical protein
MDIHLGQLGIKVMEKYLFRQHLTNMSPINKEKRMKNIILLFFASLIFGFTFGQCKNIKYNFSGVTCNTRSDSIVFSAKNYCNRNKYVLFSLEYYDSTENWQEIDNDIFTLANKGMKIIKLTPMKNMKFSFKINNIDQVYFSKPGNVSFRIVENLYSDDKIQILQSNAIKQFNICNMK